MPSFLLAGRILLTAALLASAAPRIAVAQQSLPIYTPPAAFADPAELLGRYLRVLAADPSDLSALTGAGKAAMAIGDASAAVGFYARAEEISPQDGRIKAGLASALVQMEQPREALKLFSEAVALGVPEADIASDRGLARDLRGEPKRAQADYQLALRNRADPETTRRLALSQAISGDRATALATLSPLLQRGDKAAVRARAFVLALTGDAADAEQAARAAMPSDQAVALAPFLGRLASLKSSQKAAAVHLGLFPSTGRKYSDAELFAENAAPAPTQPTQPSPTVAEAPLSASRAPRRRPGQRDENAALATPGRDASGLAEALASARPGRQPAMGRQSGVPERAASLDSLSGEAGPAGMPAPTLALVAPSPSDAAIRAKAAADAKALANAAEARRIADAKANAEARAAKEKAAAEAKAKADAKAQTAKEKAAAASKAKADARAKADAALQEKAKAEAKAKAAAPERYWVQVASGKNKSDFGKVWEGLTAKAPKLLRGRATWTAPWRASNRLLVGPFKTESEAQGFVNTLGKAGIGGIQFTTRAGTKVESLPLK